MRTVPTFRLRFQQTSEAIAKIFATLLAIPIWLLTAPFRLFSALLLIGGSAALDLARKLDKNAAEKHTVLRLLAAPITAPLALIGALTAGSGYIGSVVAALPAKVANLISSALGYLGAALTSPFIFLAHRLFDNFDDRVPEAASSEVKIIPGSTAKSMASLVDKTRPNPLLTSTPRTDHPIDSSTPSNDPVVASTDKDEQDENHQPAFKY